MSNKAIARLLESTMTNAGIIDDYDEIIGYFIENDPELADRYHEDIMTGLAFINTHLGKDYDISRDGSGDHGDNSFHMTYIFMKNES